MLGGKTYVDCDIPSFRAYIKTAIKDVYPQHPNGYKDLKENIKTLDLKKGMYPQHPIGYKKVKENIKDNVFSQNYTEQII